MELLLDLALTLSLSFIVTFLFVKVASIHPMNTDKIESTTDSDNAVKIDQFKSISQQEKMIKLEKCHCKAAGKISSVKSRNGEVISGKKIQNIMIVDDRELEEDEIEELSVIHQGEVIKLERCHFEAEDKSTSVRSRNVDSVSGNKFQNIVVVDERERKGDEIEELSMIDQFQWIPHQGEVIKLEKFHCEAQGKSTSVKLRNFDSISCNKFRNIVVVDDRELEEDEIEELSVESEEEELKKTVMSEKGRERKRSEIEIESAEEDEEKVSDCEGDSDWEEIGRHDYEEILVKKGRIRNGIMC